MGRRKYVLIVDDCQQDRMAVADVLRSDYDILEACNGKQALEILSRKRAQISLIMLDLMMPVMDGYEFLEMYRKRKEYSYLPVVVCTTEDDPEREQKSLELGAWDFVLKNSSPGIMRLRAGNAIEKSKVRFLEYDFLTGIYGQQKFYQATRELLDQRAGANFAFIHFDIDRFRIINTLYGSKEGDRLIHFVAGAIRKVMTAYGQRHIRTPWRRCVRNVCPLRRWCGDLSHTGRNPGRDPETFRTLLSGDLRGHLSGGRSGYGSGGDARQR